MPLLQIEHGEEIIMALSIAVASTCRGRSLRGALLAALAAFVVAGALPAPAGADPFAELDLPDPPVRPEIAAERLTPRPWEYDPALVEAPLKAAYHRRIERAERWNELPSAAQLALDARYYDLTLAIDPVSEQIQGTLLARLEVTAATADVAELDLAPPLLVDAVTCAGSPAAYVYEDERVTITLDRTYSQGETVEVSVSYRGTPSSSYGAFGFSSHNGDPMIWTLSEPFGARSWWPCDDWSDDKADSVDLHITVPSGLIVASNGSLEEVDYGATHDTYHWHEQYPIATYLVSLAIHPYLVYSDYYVYAPDDSMEVQFYVYPDEYDYSYEINMMTDEMIAYFATVYGEYPYIEEKYGHARFPWGGAMEHQTCTSTGAFYETIIAHELAHQWWGDLVTCADFHHIWIQEGAAVYSEALWLGHRYGPEGYWGKIDGAAYYGGGTIHVPQLDDWNRIFDYNLTYNKACWVYHMLRHVIGDDAFWQFWLTLRATHGFDSATTADNQAVAEQVSGMDLSDFFQQWIYGEYFPEYEYAWESVPVRDGHELHLTVDQVQRHGAYFHMPIDVRVTLAGGGVEEFVIDNALAHEEYMLAIAGPAEEVALDPEGWILKQAQELVTSPTFSEGILLVNGVDWETYGSEITNAYEARAFWGDLQISFWDCFDEPTGGYPATLPPATGHGRVPSSTLGDYETVIWVGNNYAGDLVCWMETAIHSYLEAGGNVLLMSRHGQSFLDTDLSDYLGISWANGTTLNNCTAVHADLTDIARTSTQTYCAVFDQSLSQETSELLYIDTSYNPDRGIGVWRAPLEGGTHNPHGGRFAFLSGRPYRWNAVDLRANVETIINGLFPTSPGAIDPDAPPGAETLTLHAPSPTLGGAQIGFSLPRAGDVRLAVYDSQGRLVETLLSEPRPAGEHRVVWPGERRGGPAAATGIYYVRLEHERETAATRILLLP